MCRLSATITWRNLTLCKAFAGIMIFMEMMISEFFLILTTTTQMAFILRLHLSTFSTKVLFMVEALLVMHLIVTGTTNGILRLSAMEIDGLRSWLFPLNHSVTIMSKTGTLHLSALT